MIAVRGDLHLAEWIVLPGVVGLTVVEGLVQSGEQAFWRAARAFLDVINELIGAVLDDLQRAAHAQNEQGEPNETKEHTKEADQRDSRGKSEIFERSSLYRMGDWFPNGSIRPKALHAHGCLSSLSRSCAGVL